MKSLLQSEMFLLLACLLAVAGFVVDPQLEGFGQAAAWRRPPC